METLPNEILLLIADKCDLLARKSLASVNFGLRSLIWRNLPALTAHRQKYVHVVTEINKIDHVLIKRSTAHYKNHDINISAYCYGNKRRCYMDTHPGCQNCFMLTSPIYFTTSCVVSMETRLRLYGIPDYCDGLYSASFAYMQRNYTLLRYVYYVGGA